MITWNEIQFADKYMFYGFILLPIMIAWYILRANKIIPGLFISNTQSFTGYKTLKTRLRHVPFVLRLLAVALLIIALARPQSKHSFQNLRTEGIDIVLSMDISASMLAQDFKPNRLEASKKVAMDFIDARPNDRIGLVIFSGESFTQCPLTTDHTVLKNLFSNLKPGIIKDGTAIGLGLATAVSRLEKSTAKSKVIILLTDGVNNQGAIAPLTAAELAKPFGIRVYTIGMGTKGKALTPIGIYPDGRYAFDYVDVDVDEATLTKIAQMNDGRYFRATNNNSLKNIYQEIDKMEKTIIEEKQFTKKSELFLPFALAALTMLLIEMLLKKFYLRGIS